MNRHGEKKRWTSVPSCVESHFKTRLIWFFDLFMLTNFEVTTMDSQEPACCDNSHLLQKLTIGTQKAKCSTVRKLIIGIQNAKCRKIRKLTFEMQSAVN